MERATIIYVVFVLLFALLMGICFVTPYLAFSSNVDPIYGAFAYTCHQKLSRSLCLFSDNKSFWLGDCVLQNGQFINGVLDRVLIRVDGPGYVGYKMPFCARDVGLYGGILLGALLYPLSRDLKNQNIFHPIFLVLAIVPLAVDGSVQLVSELGWLPFVYESTNTIRLATGLIAGIVAAYYAIPLLMSFFYSDSDNQKRKVITPKKDLTG